MVRGRAFPARVRRREMLADVAKAGRAEQGVGDGMEHHVGVAVPSETAVVRNRDSAEHNRPFAGEGVDVEAHAGARDSRAGQPALGPFEIRSGRQLVERGIASTVATSFPRRVRRSFRRSRRRLPTGHRRRAERRGGTPEVSGRAPGRRGRPFRRADPSARARVSLTGRTGAAPSKNSSGGEQPIDDLRRAEGPGGVMDQHRVALDRGEPGADRIRALGAALDERADVQAAKRRRGKICLAGADHDPRRLARRGGGPALRPPSAAPACRRSADIAWARRRRGVRPCRRRR